MKEPRESSPPKLNVQREKIRAQNIKASLNIDLRTANERRKNKRRSILTPKFINQNGTETLVQFPKH